MANKPTIQFTFTNKYPARFSGQPGLYRKTILEFEDRNGKMVRLAQEIAELKTTQITSLSRIIAGKNLIHRLSLMLSEARRGRRFSQLKDRTRQLMVHMLRKNARGARVRIAMEATSNGFKPLEAHHARDIADKLEAATNHWIVVCS